MPATVRFAYRQIRSLPQLAWCARGRRPAEDGTATIEVLHGASVEVEPERFSEGAWSGDFATAPPDEAITLVGSAGRIAGDHAVFAAPTNLNDRLFSLVTRDEVLISNSIVFLLTLADDELDPAFPHTIGAYVEFKHMGVTPTPKTLPTRRGRALRLHDAENVTLDAALTLGRRDKRIAPQPRDFADHVAFLDAEIAAVLRNAQDAARRRLRYQPLGSISSGYDSPAVMARARLHGCTRVLSIRNEAHDRPRRNDSGEEIARVLGLATITIDRREYLTVPDLDEAEFAVHGRGNEVLLTAASAPLAGTIFVTGRDGDTIWGLDPTSAHPNMVDEHGGSLSGYSTCEFRLRVGFQQFPVPFSAAHHAAALQRIARSPAMRPFSVGGAYDRPIARRLTEEAGVPRALFGRRKMGTAHAPLTDLGNFSASGRRRFLAYRVEAARALSPATHLELRLGRLARKATRGVEWGLDRLGLHIGAILPSRYASWLSGFEHLNHWGIAETRARYRLPGDL